MVGKLSGNQPASPLEFRSRIPIPAVQASSAGGLQVQVSTVPRIAGALLLRPQPHVDERGFFSRTFDA
jgi:hypothetical protein